jgi:hypothetical protein
MKPSMGRMAGKGSEASVVGKEMWRIGLVFTIVWIVW